MVCKVESRNEERAGASQKAAEDADENQISSPLFSWKLDLFFLYNCQPGSCISSAPCFGVAPVRLAFPRLCCASREDRGATGWGQQCRSPGAALAGDVGQRPPGGAHTPPSPAPGLPLTPQNHTTNCPARPTEGPGTKAAFSFKTTRGGSSAKARAASSPGDLSLRKYFLQRGLTAAAGTMGDSQHEQS